MKMKVTLFGMMLGSALLATSCLSEDHDLSSPAEEIQTGRLVLNLNSNTSFHEQTRALDEADYRTTDNYTVQLLQEGELLVECKASEVGEYLPKELNPGAYVVKAFYGTERPYSRDEFRVEGSTEFNISKGVTSNVTVPCLPTCGKLSVVFDADMATYYDTYSVTYSGAEAFSGNTLAWAKADTEPWYVRVGAEGETLTYTVSVIAKDAYVHVDENGQKQASGTATGTFTLARNHGYRLTVKPNYTATGEGGLKVSITIDDTLNDRPETIVVPVSWL